MSFELPKALVDQVRGGNVVLFLGAGASRGAMHPTGAPSPSATELAARLSADFLGCQFSDRPLDQIAELAISEHDLLTVQHRIKEIFEPFGPAPFHLLIPTFSWVAIASTNYDLVVERAYATASQPVQGLAPFKKTANVSTNVCARATCRCSSCTAVSVMLTIRNVL